MNKKINELIYQCEIEFIQPTGEVVFAISKSDENCSSLKELHTLFVSYGYKEVSPQIENQDDNYELSLKLGDGSWSNSCRIYKNLSSLWVYAQRLRKVPDFAFVADDKTWIKPGLAPDSIKKYEIYFAWINLLKRLSEDEKDGVFKYIVNSEKGLKRHSFSVIKNFEQINSAYIPLCSAGTVADLVGKLDIIDAHKTERKEVMLKTLSDILDAHSDQDPICWIIEHEKAFKRKYYENYDIYTQKFSVNKLLNEVLEKHNDYTSKVLESVSSNQTKALALPGALIAAGALIRSTNKSSLLLICIGIYFVYIFTKSANSISRVSLTNFHDQLDKAFSDFTGLDVEGEVVSAASDAKKKIKNQIYSAKDRLDMIDSSALYILIVCCVFAALNAFPLPQMTAALEFFLSMAYSLISTLIELIKSLHLTFI